MFNGISVKLTIKTKIILNNIKAARKHTHTPHYVI